MPRPILTTKRVVQGSKTEYALEMDGKVTSFVCKERYPDGLVKWYPFRYFEGDIPPQQKYEKIKYISSEDGVIPKTGFTTSLESGFGFTRVQGVAQLFRYLEMCADKIEGVVFTKDRTEFTDGVLYIAREEFGRLRNRTKLFTDSTRQEQTQVHRSVLNKLLPDEFEEPGDLMYFEGMLARFLNKYNGSSIKLSADDIEAITKNFNVEPESVVSTKRAVDKVYIEDVLEEFRKIRSLKNDTNSLEERWHKFFKNHTWIFSNIFSYPAVFLKDKVNVSGHTISGSTDKIVDFLYKSSFTDNVAFIEIKTHKTKLMQSTPYRKPDIFPVSKEVTGAIIQVIDQKTNFMKSHDSLTKGSSVQSLNSRCVVIAGMLSDLDTEYKKKSFELFRLSNKDVEIITFDEVEKKMETVLELFTK